MHALQETQQYLLNDFKKLPYFDRQHYQSISLANRINGILGSRGTGKTTFLLQTAIKKGAFDGKALYVSADNVFFLDNKLIDLAEWAYKTTDINYLLIDEIHKYPNWNQELKNIYDSFLNMNVCFSGSSMIDIIRSKYDLSRRVTLYPMHGFSFREYLLYHYDIKVKRITLEELASSHVKLALAIQCPKILKYFKEYLAFGYYPFTKNLDIQSARFQAIENIAQKTIYEDIATLHSLKTASLLIIEKLYKYILGSLPGEINVNKLASHLQKDFNDVSRYLSYLDQAGLISALYTKKAGKALLGTPSKILPENSNMIYAHYLAQTQDSMIGKVRETFVVNQLKSAGYQVHFSSIGDYQVDDYHFEIGGKNKTTKQLKNQNNAFVLADDLIIGSEKIIPLYLMGLLY